MLTLQTKVLNCDGTVHACHRAKRPLAQHADKLCWCVDKQATPKHVSATTAASHPFTQFNQQHSNSQKQLCAQTQSHLNSSPRKVTTARIQNQQVRMHTSLHNSASAFCVRMQHTQTGLRRGQPNESTGSTQTSAASKSAHLSIWHLPSGHTNLSAIQKTRCDHDACMKQKWLMQS